MKRTSCWLSLLIGIFWVTCSVFAASTASGEIPEVLSPWKGWVLKGYETQLCPIPYNNAESHFCVWPTELKCVITPQSGQFTQKVVNYVEGFIPLPGDNQHWPQAVKINQKLVPVLSQQEKPVLFLPVGEYTIEGKFVWDLLPDALQIPSEIGIFQLVVNGKEINQPERDDQNRVWFGAQIDHNIKEKEQDTLSIKVFRLIEDQIPVVDNTLLRIKVTGQTREVSIGPVLEPNTLPLDVSSSLPGKLEENGLLRLQIKPGVWDIRIKSRYLGKQDKLTNISRPSPWPSEEVWSFQPQNHLRLVDIEGGVSLDPQQTDMPKAWREFPAYLMKAGTTLKIIEKRRGQAQHRGETINLQRKMWLDFSGKGFTLQDNLTGTLEQHWRIQGVVPLKLGRVTVDGQDRLITQLSPDQPAGVEIRNGHLNLNAVSRITERLFNLPAIGWDLDVQSLSTLLYLPPGWKLLGAWGVDTVSHAWVQDWTLLDLFLVLIVTFAVMKLLGFQWGLIAGLTLTLIYHEKGSPIYGWLNVIAVLALIKVLTLEKTPRWIRYYFHISFILLILSILPFMVQQIRTAIYPQLTQPSTGVVALYDQGMGRNQLAGSAMPLPQVAMEAMSEAPGKVKALTKGNLYERKEAQRPLQDYDPNAKVQTGPGVPAWQWDAYQLDWNGPVLKDQRLKIWLLPAWINSIVKCLQVLLMSVLLYGLAFPYRTRMKLNNSFSTLGTPAMTLMWATIMGASLMMSIVPAPVYADFPNPSMLDDLRNRLLEPPHCLPDCAAIERMQVQINNNQLTIRSTIHNASGSAVPLPATLNKWMPRTVLIDGAVATRLQSDLEHQLWVYLEQGVHEVVIEGPIGEQDKFEVFVPLKPKMIIVEKEGWEVEGIYQHRLQGDNFYFTRVKQSVAQDASNQPLTFETGRIPNFVVLTRTIRLGFDWEMLNVLQRIAPQAGALSVAIPLLTDESVLSDEVNVKEGQVFVSLAANQQQIAWRSKLKIVPQLKFTAMNSEFVKEIWQLDAIPQWHCSLQGIPVIHQRNNQDRWFPTWAPWPGESMSLDVTKPTAMAGSTLTIDESRLSVTPGKRAADNSLIFTARSSQGGTHQLQIPADAELKDVLINGMSQPINSKQGEITIPLNPGSQAVEIKWQSLKGIVWHYLTPKVQLNNPSSNVHIDLQLSKDRWILLLGGPAMGPAVLFWGIVIVIVLAAFALSKSGLTPLNAWQWFLLAIGVVIATPLAAIFVVVWFVAMNHRMKKAQACTQLSPEAFQLIQISLGLLTVVFIVSLFTSISQGLLGSPQMQLSAPPINIAQSYFTLPAKYQLQWYQDVTQDYLSQAWVISLPMYCYRILMLLWALWLAFSLIKWMRWGWECFSAQGIWRRILQNKETKSESNID